jgi:hypothetical protein
MSVATHGFNPLGLRSFAIPVTTSSSPANGESIAAGSYELTASVDMTVMLGVGSGNITATLLSATTSQPAAGSPNRMWTMSAGQSKMIEVRSAGKIAAIAVSSSGTLSVCGPWGKAGMP